MKIRTLPFTSLLLLLLALPGWSVAQANQTTPSDRPAPVVGPQEEPDIVVSSNGSLSNYSTYQNGNHFNIVIASGQEPRMNMKPGVLLREARMRRDAGELVLMFELTPGTVARVTHNGARLEIFLVAESSLANGRADDSAPLIRSVRANSPSQPSELVASAAAPGPTVEPASETTSAVIPPAAQGPGPKSGAELDLSVPESPAFAVLGLTPMSVLRPATPRALATGLLNGVDKEGNFQTGIAIDTAPYLLFLGDSLTLSQYRSSVATRLVARTQASFATARGASEGDKSVRLALGFHFTLWDRGDPRMDEQLTQCFRDSLSLDLPGTPEQQELILRPRWSKCQEDARKRNWNRSSWLVGAAPSWITPTGNFRQARWNGGGLWTSFAYGFESIPGLRDTSQLILHARYRTDERLPDPTVTGAFFVQDSFLLGSRLRLGRPDFTGNFEGLYVRNMPEGRDSDDSYRLSFGAERKLTQDLWLSLTFGGEGGRRDGKNQGFVLTTFKYAFSKGPR